MVRAVSVFGVLFIARLLTSSFRIAPFSVWSPIAFLWHDAFIALAFAMIDRAIRVRWLRWGLYTLIIAYITVNVPVTRVLSSPLTLPMIRAARGPLSDSMVYHLTARNIGAMLLTAGSGV